MIRQKFTVAIPNDEGGIVLSPMKKWLRQNLDKVPPGLDPTYSTSRQLFAGLKKLGWNFQAHIPQFSMASSHEFK